jgi:hypothetical protein
MHAGPRVVAHGPAEFNALPTTVIQQIDEPFVTWQGLPSRLAFVGAFGAVGFEQAARTAAARESTAKVRRRRVMEGPLGGR